ncbi:MAG: MFS transporter [Anaerolineales bacterium]|nr:MFS transporter [Anaerolineales bacterium]MCB0011132.1 MFS transporter [Anaerolineales bacterium]MCB8959231.1 MFS transporter [Ardenticatenales bacterium]
MMATEERQARWEVQLGFLTFGRLLLNTMLRLGYPFLPELARGLAVSQADIASVIALGNLSGLASPLFGPLSERFGRRLMIVISYLILGLGALLLLIWPRFWALSVFLILLALMKVIHDPALQAYVGERVPYNRRGRAIAVIEIAWGGALLFGAPLVGWLIQWQNWAAPYILFSLLGMLVGLLLYRLMPRALPVAGRLVAKRGDWARLLNRPVVWATASFLILLVLANDIFFIVYGDWLETRFNLELTQVGLSSSVIGAAELVGITLVGFLSDRLGKRRLILIMGLVNSVAYALIPAIDFGLVPALLALFLLFFSFEATIVGSLPLLTELVPEARAVFISVMTGAMSLGRGLGSFIGPRLPAGIEANSYVAAALMIVALLILWRFVTDPGDAAAH